MCKCNYFITSLGLKMKFQNIKKPKQTENRGDNKKDVRDRSYLVYWNLLSRLTFTCITVNYAINVMLLESEGL